MREFHADTGATPDECRLADVREQIARRGWWWQTPGELEFAAKLAWRNNRRCIGRAGWRGLEVVDARHLATAAEIFEACTNHIRHSTNGGRIRPLMTVFAPHDPAAGGPRIHNYQLVHYAGYALPDGTIIGDPAEVAFTKKAIAASWRPPSNPGPFDLLPLLIETPSEGIHVFELPRDAVLEVAIRHPTLAWFAELGLKWHALPAVSNLVFDGGGVRYPAAPFSGYYMETEIAVRNFGDAARYNMLPVVADRLDPRMRREDPFWRDRAMVELCAAVLHSFREDGVTIVDHHAASRQFMTHVANEEAAGRTVPGDWPWLVPPVSGSASPVFHRYYDPARRFPDFLEAGASGCPFHNSQVPS